ncbi:hydrogenase expression/formation protein [Telmatospirillum siberiense]|uniref:Hydrogenase expression/formation protein n=1 Tax=Telmatospirillum siberiense TaxID=382514 RepID=A0A2N3PSJ3_9PROT|nr:hydrogenase expression/formation protein [Telmatospirillum siberiense]PKU23373.1 hydrogenase expression/formation protein [Telmatospirillum siberiense]
MTGPSVTDALIALATPQRPMPLLLDDAEAARHQDVRAVLADVVQALCDIGRGKIPGRWIDIASLEGGSRALLSSMLSVGEISATLAATPPTRIQETSLYGVWMVDGERQGLEVADFPAIARDAARRGSARLDMPAVEDLPEGTMNILPVLAEIAHHMAAEAGEHEINLSLMPMSPADHRVLEETLGIGALEIWSRGYGSCRIRAAALRNVWRIQYFNSDGKEILDVVQIGDVPVAARATPEDMDDQIGRVRDLMAAYFPEEP